MSPEIQERHRIRNYRDVFYVPNFLSKDEEDYVLRKICDSPQQKWKQLAKRRLQIWGGEITSKGLFPQNLPSYMTNYPNIIEKLRESGAFATSPHQEPNHMILNEYRPGQGIMPHEDGPKYFPVVATISLGSHALFNYYAYKADQTCDDTSKIVDQVPVLSVLLEPRSLIISSGQMYTSHLHGIDPVEEDRILPPSPVVLHPNKTDERMLHRDGIAIGNWDLLEDETAKRIIADGGILARGTRYSLTCRDVERISLGKSFKLN